MMRVISSDGNDDYNTERRKGWAWYRAILMMSARQSDGNDDYNTEKRKWWVWYRVMVVIVLQREENYSEVMIVMSGTQIDDNDKRDIEWY